VSGFTAETWDRAPAFSGRLATPADVTEGRAVFSMSETVDPAPLDEPLPAPVIWYEDEDAPDAGAAALVVQAESHGAEDGAVLEVLGLLLPDGRTAVGFGEDVDWVAATDPVWRDLVEDALFAGGGA
jgi:hypothetical protein